MNPIFTLYHPPAANIATTQLASKIPLHFERKLLKIFLLERLADFLREIYIPRNKQYGKSLMDDYDMDRQLIQNLIQEMTQNGDYTLQGIAYYTQLPFDMIFDASFGVNHPGSFSLWIKIVNLFLKSRPDIMQVLYARLMELKDKNELTLHSLLEE